MLSTLQTDPSFQFEGFEIERFERQLLVKGRAAPIGRRGFDLLLVLAESAGTLLLKDELLNRVWPGLFVLENNIAVQINALRRLIGADAIATVSGHGYRLAAKRLESNPCEGRQLSTALIALLLAEAPQLKDLLARHTPSMLARPGLEAVPCSCTRQVEKREH